MGDFTEKYLPAIRERMVQEMDAIGTEMVEDAQAAVSHPVVRVDGVVVQRSEPGEDPWLDTGHLFESFRHEIDEPELMLLIINDAEYAQRLNDGHGNVAPRPFGDHLIEGWLGKLGPRMSDAILGKI
jgi:hypothetical protein